ncbi:MAG: DNA mismatch repair endonuclease MutL [Lachnospiraceae bacterium]|nr:DNA mismatch repair endonuclease MutL [Lachnospiraceae bacterium]
MSRIELLDEATINKIAAGEVIERPLSVVKELVENALDAGAGAVTIEIKGGGIDFIRVTDNGAGIPAEEVRLAFTPHATSKIRSADDLFDIRSLGFRGEALSTIAAVAQIEMITKTPGSLTGVLYRADGGKEISFEEVGCADGTTFIARNLFFHVPARRKFLKSAMTEAGYINEFVQQIAIARSDIAFKFVVNNTNKLVTNGNGSVKDNIYRVYGRDISDEILPVKASDNGMSISGYIAKPVVARNNRSQEIFFVNGHSVEDRILQKAVEAAYKPFLMQHKFPFVYLFLSLDPGMVDVNVHPRKTEVKFSLGNTVFDFTERAVESVLRSGELINKVELVPEKKTEYRPEKKAPEPFERKKDFDIDHLSDIMSGQSDSESDSGFFVERGLKTGSLIPEQSVEHGPQIPNVEQSVGHGPRIPNVEQSVGNGPQIPNVEQSVEHGPQIPGKEHGSGIPDTVQKSGAPDPAREPVTPDVVRETPDVVRETPDVVRETGTPYITENVTASQMELFEERAIDPSNRPYFRIVGCVFDTYWIIEYKDKMFMIDQHAAHEKVMYERFTKEYRDKQVVSQYVEPPVLITVAGRQEETIERYSEAFASLGFEIERFEGNEYALRAVPSGFMKLEEKDIFTGLLDELSEELKETEDVSVIHDRLAQMSCKAAVKGGNRLSLKEAEELLSELLSLDNPYNCPHGRPTMVEFSKRDIEKFFKRIV